MSFSNSIGGHLRTIGTKLIDRLAPKTAPPAQPWSTVVEDPLVGPVRLTGSFRRIDSGGHLLLVVHGLGGCAESNYAIKAAITAEQEGLSCLRLNLRGADRKGEDYYHAALTSDLVAALDSPDVRSFDRVSILGYSLGGHVALRYATEDPEIRVNVAALCTPLDLGLTGRCLDEARFWPYRRYLLAQLTTIYAAVAAHRAVPVPVETASRIRTLREWDHRIVAPRHGFDSADDYYRRASVAPRLDRLAVPALLIAAEDDPMVPAQTLRTVLETLDGHDEEASLNGSSTVRSERHRLVVRWAKRGGHVGFPASTDVGLPGGVGIESQAIGWLKAGTR